MFVYMSQSQVQDLLEESKENLTGEVSTIGDKIEGLKSQMSDLKTQLYAKLGSAINLEAGDD
jgi:prefoldin subunit 4